MTDILHVDSLDVLPFSPSGGGRGGGWRKGERRGGRRRAAKKKRWRRFALAFQ